MKRSVDKLSTGLFNLFAKIKKYQEFPFRYKGEHKFINKQSKTIYISILIL